MFAFFLRSYLYNFMNHISSKLSGVFIDVTDIACQEGDKVEIFGDHLPVTVLSNILDTIPYEILTAVSDRVKRIYYQN